MYYFSMAAYVSILRKQISWSFYNKALPKSNLKSGSAPALTMKNMAENNLLEERPLGLSLNFGISPHLKDISFMQNHIVGQILVWVRKQMCCGGFD